MEGQARGGSEATQPEARQRSDQFHESRPDRGGEIPPCSIKTALPAYYIAMEASYTVEQKDYDRAIDNARIIGDASGAVVYPVVAGVLISDELDEGDSGQDPRGRRSVPGVRRTRSSVLAST